MKPGLYRIDFGTHTATARVRILCGQLVVIMPSGWHHPVETIEARWERIGD